MDSCYLQQLQQLYQLAATAPAADSAASSSSTKPRPKVLDTRPKHKYLQHRLLYSANIQLPSLTSSCYLLPDKSERFAVIVPSSDVYTVVQDRYQQGKQLADGPMAVFLAGAASVLDFLATRGWTGVTCLQDCPALWDAAQQLQLIESTQINPQLLARRCLFTPSQLLASEIGTIEATLAARYAKQQRQQQKTVDSGNISRDCAEQHLHSRLVTDAGMHALHSVVLQALDVGCGSGRDLCWLASRQQVVCLPGWDQQPQDHQQQQQQQGLCSNMDEQRQQHVQLAWHVTGIDNWVGALERVHDLAAAMQLPQTHVELVVGSICSQSGDIVMQQLPANSRLHKSSHATVTHAASASNVSSSTAATATAVVDTAGDHTAMAASSPAEQQSSDVLKYNVTSNYDLIVCVRFLERALLPRLKAMLKPGGFVLYSTFVDGPGLRAFGRPSGPKHVLQPAELAKSWFGTDNGFAVLRDEVALTGDGREVCMFAAQRCV